MYCSTYWRRCCSLWHLLLTGISSNNIGIMTWVNNYIHVNHWDVITHPCRNFNGGWIKPPLKLGHGWVIASHTTRVWLLITDPWLNLSWTMVVKGAPWINSTIYWHVIHLNGTGTTAPNGTWRNISDDCTVWIIALHKTHDCIYSTFMDWIMFA